MRKVWRVRAGRTGPVATLPNLKKVLLGHRGLAGASSQRFFEPDFARDSHDPFALHGMTEATERIARAVRRQQRIVVYGDYDADGVTGTAILLAVLRQAGARVIPYLPHRLDDGYGLNRSVLKNLQSEFDLLITIDCGISNAAEIAWLRRQGKEVIVIDHHELPAQLPPAAVILHPRHPEGVYPFQWLCGAGLAWKVAQGLLRHPQLAKTSQPGSEQWLLDLAALGTIADAVPLLGENRTIVYYGLQVLRRTRRAGLGALLDQLRLTSGPISVDDVAWRIIPRLNAAGRMDHPQPALDLLLATSPAGVPAILDRLHQLNQQRQIVTQRVLAQAQGRVDPAAALLFAADTNWPAGVVGLVAGQLADAYGRPAIVVGGNGRQAVGSARSPAGISILPLLEAARSYLTTLGGHAQAAGFSLHPRDLPAFEASVVRQAGQHVVSRAAAAEAEAYVAPHLVSWDTLDLIERFEPFGEGNPKPTFVATKLPVVDMRSVGRRGDHLKLRVMCEDEAIDAIGFGLVRKTKGLTRYVDALFQLERNEFRGRTSLQLYLRDIAPTGHVAIEPAAA